jgi:hypothetical protein
MTIITVTPPTTVATEEDLQLDLYVDGPQWEGIFDSLEVWRSRTGAQGPYEALTGPTWMTPRLPAGAPDAPALAQTGPSLNISGSTLSLLVDEETSISVTFTGTNPLTMAQCATQIIAQGLRMVRAYVINNLLVIESAQPGNIATLRVVGGNAAPMLGLPTTEPASVAFGKDARIPLVHGVDRYHFTDYNGDPDYFYKTRFFNGLTNTYSDFSLPFSGKYISALSPTSIIRGTIDLVDSKGIALCNRAILLSPKSQGSLVEGRVMVDSDTQEYTDANGHLEFTLIRGQNYTVAIAGTDIVRDFTAPTDTSIDTFNMLDPALSSNDVFTVQQPNIDYMVRRSL